MKRKRLILLALVLLFSTVSAFALSPQTPEALKRAVAGQTFEARCTGYESSGDHFSMYLKLYERARYAEADILAVSGTGYISADIGSAMIYSVTPSENGYVLNEPREDEDAQADVQPDAEAGDSDADPKSAMAYAFLMDDDDFSFDVPDPDAAPVYLIPDGNGCFLAQDAEGWYYMKEALELSCPIAEDAQYIDASDPDGEAATYAAEALISAVQDDRRQFSSVEVTFNDDGEICLLRKNPAEEGEF